MYYWSRNGISFYRSTFEIGHLEGRNKEKSKAGEKKQMKNNVHVAQTTDRFRSIAIKIFDGKICFIFSVFSIFSLFRFLFRHFSLQSFHIWVVWRVCTVCALEKKNLEISNENLWYRRSYPAFRCFLFSLSWRRPFNSSFQISYFSPFFWIDKLLCFQVARPIHTMRIHLILWDEFFTRKQWTEETNVNRFLLQSTIIDRTTLFDHSVLPIQVNIFSLFTGTLKTMIMDFCHWHISVFFPIRFIRVKFFLFCFSSSLFFWGFLCEISNECTINFYDGKI